MSDTKTYVVPDNLTGNNDNLATMAMMSNGAMVCGTIHLCILCGCTSCAG